MVQIHSPRPLPSTIYAAFSTSGSASFLRTIRTTSAILGGSAKPKAHRFCLFQTERGIFFHLAIAVSHGLIFMSHPKSFQVSMDAILSESRKTVSAECMKACFGLLQFFQSGM
jgi:hypothetical protein